MVAGRGPATLSLAGRRADAMFASAIDADAGLHQRTVIREAAANAGREDPPLLFPGLSVLLADTRAEAAAIEQATYPPSAGRVRTGPRWSVVGTPEDAVAAIAARAEGDALDGFIAFPVGSWRSIELLFDEVMPRLREIGLIGGLPSE